MHQFLADYWTVLVECRYILLVGAVIITVAAINDRRNRS